jgi:uncharacterized membrane protein YeiH
MTMTKLRPRFVLFVAIVLLQAVLGCLASDDSGAGAGAGGRTAVSHQHVFGSKSRPTTPFGIQIDPTTSRIINPSSKPTTTSSKTTISNLIPRGGAEFAVDILRWIDLFGTGLFAFSGALTAGRKGMDLLGMEIIAMITAVGGGTVRDLFFNQGPVFWLLDGIYVKICTVVTLLTFVAWPHLEQRFNIKDSALPICYADAFCLGAFAVVGTQKAVDMDLEPALWVVFGLLTAVFGGVTRDILCLQRPRIMYPERSQYGGPPLLGSAVYAWLIYGQKVNARLAACISIMVTFTARVRSFNSPRRLPHWKKPENSGEI